MTVCKNKIKLAYNDYIKGKYFNFKACADDLKISCVCLWSHFKAIDTNYQLTRQRTVTDLITTQLREGKSWSYIDSQLLCASVFLTIKRQIVRTLKEKQVTKTIELRNSGMCISDIALQVNRSSEWVRKTLKQMGFAQSRTTHGNYKGRKTNSGVYYSAQFRLSSDAGIKLHYAVRKYYDFTCQICGKTEEEQRQDQVTRGKRPQNLSVHHKDGNTQNNDFSNFNVLCCSCHLSGHCKGHKHSEETKKKMSIAQQLRRQKVKTAHF